MMKRYGTIVLLIILCVGFSASSLSCFGKPPKEMTYDELIKMGRRKLEDDKGAQAYTYFRDAHKLKPNKSDPMWGIVLSDAQRMIANIDGTIDILWGVYVYQPSISECVRACDRLVGCDKKVEYGIFDRIRSSAETCLKDCPWGLQPYMFEAITECDDCRCVRRKALEWIISTSPEDCELLCKDLDLCGLIDPPLTYDLPNCTEQCPHMYVEHHSLCYLDHLGECSRKDRTCFEHTIVGLQKLFKEFGARLPVEITEYSDPLLTRYDQFYLKTHSWKIKEPPMELILDGRFGQEELHFIRMLSHAFSAFVLLMTSTNLDINTVTFDLHFDIPGETFDLLNIQDILSHLSFFLHDLTEALENTLYDPIFPGAFIIKGDDWAIPQIEEGGIELGLALGEFSQFIYTMMADTDRQDGKALGYTDANKNFHWDPNETLTFRGLNITLTYDQALALANMCAALQDNLLNRVPFDISFLGTVLDSFDQTLLKILLKIIADLYLENGQIDISELFYNPNPTGFRDMLIEIVDILKTLQGMDLQYEVYKLAESEF